MAEDEQQNPRAITPNVDPALHPHPAPGSSLVESLGGTVDGMRQLFTDVGMRPYRVVSVVAVWSGGSVGRGTQTIESEIELLPTPKVDLRSLGTRILSGGRVDDGYARLSEVSPRYTEDDIQTLFHVKPLPKGREGFIEVRVDDRDGPTKRRRFVVSGVPFRDAENFQWLVRLVNQEPDRKRDGSPTGPRKHFDRRSV